MDAAALFRAVYDNPSSDEARQVLADVLIEANDPRGEFIALQMQSTRGRKAELKLEKLLERHRAQFLGPLGAVVPERGQVWEKGFLTEAHARLDGSLFDEPSWATVKRLEVFSRTTQPRELLSPHMRSLKTVVGLPRHAVRPLFSGDTATSLWSVAVEGPGTAEAWEPAELDALRNATSLPELRTLAVSIWRFGIDELEWLWTAPVFGRLRVMQLVVHRVAMNLGTLRDRLLVLDDTPDALVLDGRQLDAKLKPDAEWSVLHVHAKAPLVDVVVHDIELLLQSLPANALTRFDFTADHVPQRDALARVKAATRRFSRLATVSWPQTAR